MKAAAKLSLAVKQSHAAKRSLAVQSHHVADVRHHLAADVLSQPVGAVQLQAAVQQLQQQQQQLQQLQRLKKLQLLQQRQKQSNFAFS